METKTKTDNDGYAIRRVGAVTRVGYVIVGSLIIAAAAYGTFREMRRQEAAGTVTSVMAGQVTRRNRSRIEYRPNIIFTSTDGRKYSFIGSPVSREPEVGQPVTVVYDKNDPQAAHVKSTVYYLVLFALFILGALCLRVGFFFGAERVRRNWIFLEGKKFK